MVLHHDLSDNITSKVGYTSREVAYTAGLLQILDPFSE